MFKWLRNLFPFGPRLPDAVYEYEDFGGLKDFKRRCQRCHQWFIKNSENPRDFSYIPVNGIVIDKDCSCHKRRR